MRVVDKLQPAEGQRQPTRGSGYVARSSSNDLYAVLDLILDKGLVADVERVNGEGLIDKDGLVASVVFRGTVEDRRRADKVLNATSPGEGDRPQLDVAHFVLDVQV